MPEFHLAGITPEYRNLDAFTQGYIEALFFTEGGEHNLRDAGFSDLAPETLTTILEDCRKFQTTNEALLTEAMELPPSSQYDMTAAGRDFWFTRNGHGVGYWDREELPQALKDALTAAAQDVPEQHVYLGDDGNVYA